MARSYGGVQAAGTWTFCYIAAPTSFFLLTIIQTGELDVAFVSVDMFHRKVYRLEPCSAPRRNRQRHYSPKFQHNQSSGLVLIPLERL
ncbi:MAG: hypothetical protein ACLU18_17110 [Bacteroides thetaiotaomicron]